MAGLMAEYIKRKNNYAMKKKKKNKIVKDGKTYKSVPSGEPVKRTAKETYMDMFEKNKHIPGWLLEMKAHDAALQKELVLKEGDWVPKKKNNYAMKYKNNRIDINHPRKRIIEDAKTLGKGLGKDKAWVSQLTGEEEVGDEGQYYVDDPGVELGTKTYRALTQDKGTEWEEGGVDVTDLVGQVSEDLRTEGEDYSNWLRDETAFIIPRIDEETGEEYMESIYDESVTADEMKKAIRDQIDKGEVDFSDYDLDLDYPKDQIEFDLWDFFNDEEGTLDKEQIMNIYTSGLIRDWEGHSIHPDKEELSRRVYNRPTTKGEDVGNRHDRQLAFLNDIESTIAGMSEAEKKRLAPEIARLLRLGQGGDEIGVDWYAEGDESAIGKIYQRLFRGKGEEVSPSAEQDIEKYRFEDALKQYLIKGGRMPIKK